MSATGEIFRLLQPGLMSIDELKEIISQRGVCIKSSENKTKYELVELYERLLMPLSQRTFPNLHRGKIINKKIAEEDRKQARNKPYSSNDFQYGFKDKLSESSSKHHISPQSSSSSSSNRDRLKPPIDTSSLPAKKICLRRSSSGKDLDKVVINDHPKRSSNCLKEESGNEQKADKQGADKLSPVKIPLSPHKESEGKAKEEPNAKRRKIAWP